MAGGIIQVTPELLRGKANDVRNYRGQHDDTMVKLGNLIRSLNEIWKGSAQDAFVAKYESMQTTFRNFSELLEDYAKLMDMTANGMEEKDQSLKTTIENFG